MVFDLDDTLVVEEATARRSLEQAAAEVLDGVDPSRTADVVLAQARSFWHAGPFHSLCLSLGFASWEGLWSTFDGCHPSVEGLREWVPGFRRDVWDQSLRDLGVRAPEFAGAMADSFALRQAEGHPTIRGAGEVVRMLATRCRLGLLTNGPSDVQRIKLDRTGLGQHFRSVVISGEVGTGKPDTEVFSLVLEGLGASPEQSVMVGDSWQRDVLGARAAGMTAIWVSHGRPRPDPLPEVVVVPDVAHVGQAMPFNVG